MAKRATDYERVAFILSREQKKQLIRWCDDHDISITQAMRATVANLLSKKEIVLCPTIKRQAPRV